MVLGLLVHVTPSNFFIRILRSEALVYKSYFLSTAVLRKLFEIRFSYKHCNFSRVCLLVKMASITVTRSIFILISSIKKTREICLWVMEYTLRIWTMQTRQLKKKIISGWLQTLSAVDVSRKQEFHAFVLTEITRKWIASFLGPIIFLCKRSMKAYND